MSAQNVQSGKNQSAIKNVLPVKKQQPTKTNLSTGKGAGEMRQSAEKRRPVKSVTGKNTGSKTTTGKTMLAEKRRKFLLKSLPIFCLCAILGLLF